MGMKIKLKEASPRKFRAKPSDRGVGGKWGSIDVNKPFNDATQRRQSAALDWEKYGCQSDRFQARFAQALKASGLPWELDAERCEYSSVAVYGNMEQLVGMEVPTNYGHIDYDSIIDRNATLGDRLLFKIAKTIGEDFGEEIAFDGDMEMTTSTCHIYHASMEGGYDAHKDDGTWPTIQECIDMTLDTLRSITAYLKKMTPDLQRETSRTFHESKCSMQKRIESFTKSKSASGRSFYGTYRAR